MTEEFEDFETQSELIPNEKQEPAGEIVVVEEEKVKSIVESLLFAATRPMSFEVIRGIFAGSNIKAPLLKKALNELMVEYAGGERGVVLEDVAGGFQIRTKQENMQFIRRMVKGRPFKLSGPSLETIAIIAYKQPCIKSEIDQIRGVESGHLVRLLMEKGLVQFAGKSELPGKPMMYKTTKKFLEIFGLRTLRELPSLSEIEELIPEGIGAPEQERRTLDQLTDDLSLRYGDRDIEAEEEYSKITERLSEVNTTTDFFEKEKQRQREQKDRDKADDIRERLMLGHEVTPRDRNWLERFETAGVVTAEAGVETSLANSLEKLTTQNEETSMDEQQELAAVAVSASAAEKRKNGDDVEDDTKDDKKDGKKDNTEDDEFDDDDGDDFDDDLDDEFDDDDEDDEIAEHEEH